MKVARPSLNLWVTTEAEAARGITASCCLPSPSPRKSSEADTAGHRAGYSRGRVQRISNAEMFEGTSADREKTFCVEKTTAQTPQPTGTGLSFRQQQQSTKSWQEKQL